MYSCVVVIPPPPLLHQPPLSISRVRMCCRPCYCVITTLPCWCRWALWYDNAKLKAATETWEENLKHIMAFETVEEFWALFNNVMPPSMLAVSDGRGFIHASFFSLLRVFNFGCFRSTRRCEVALSCLLSCYCVVMCPAIKKSKDTRIYLVDYSMPRFVQAP